MTDPLARLILNVHAEVDALRASRGLDPYQWKKIDVPESFIAKFEGMVEKAELHASGSVDGDTPTPSAEGWPYRVMGTETEPAHGVETSRASRFNSDPLASSSGSSGWEGENPPLGNSENGRRVASERQTPKLPDSHLPDYTTPAHPRTLEHVETCSDHVCREIYDQYVYYKAHPRMEITPQFQAELDRWATESRLGPNQP